MRSVLGLFLGVAPGRYCMTANLPAHSGAEAAHAHPPFMTFTEREHESIQLRLTADSTR